MPRSTSITGDALQVQRLLVWARKAGIHLNRVAIGGCTVDVAPEREPVKSPRKPQPETPRETIYGRFGGEVLKEAHSRGDFDDGLLPVVERK